MALLLMVPPAQAAVIVGAPAGGTLSAATGGAPAAATVPTLDSEQWKFLTLINNFRAQNGVNALQVSVALQNSSQWMSTDMATKNYFSHTDSLGRDPGTRMAAFGYNYPTWWGENIAAGYVDAQSALNGWINACDPDASGQCTYAHRQNMLGPHYVVMGIGRAYDPGSTYGWYWTTDFGGYLDQTIPPPTSACDLNGDNFTNVVDVQQSVNQALGVAACTADINKDGLCNVLDVQRVTNAALGGVCVSP